MKERPPVEPSKASPTKSNGEANERSESTPGLMEEVWAETERRRRILDPTTIDETWRLAGIVAKSGINGVTTAERAHVLIQLATELNLSSMMGLRGLYVTDDAKVGLYADTMVALILRSGLAAKWNVLETTRERCTIEAQRVGGEPLKLTWTIDEANKIFLDKESTKCLTSKMPWKNGPRQMLRHRCAAELAREVFPDVILGMHTPDELDSLPASERASVRSVDLTPKKPYEAPRIVEDRPATTADVLRRSVAAAPTVDQDYVTGGRTVAEWRERIQAAASGADYLDALEKVRVEIQRTVPRGPVRDALKEAFAQAKKKREADAPAPVATEAEEILGQWKTHVWAIENPQHVLNSLGKHILEFPESLRSRVISVAEQRLSAFKWSEGRDIAADVREACTKAGA